MKININELQEKVQLLASSGQVNKAIELLENTIQSNSRIMELWMLLSSVYRAIGQTDTAIATIKRSIQHLPKNPRIWTNLGHMYVEQGRYDQALGPLKRATSLDSKDTSAWYSLGMAWVGKEDYESAIRSFQKAVKLDPNRKDAWRQLGSVLEDNKQYKEAIKAYNKVLELDPSFADAWAELGVTYKNKGDFKKAIEAFERSLKINPKVSPYWFHLGTTLSKAGKLDRAIEALKKGLDLDSSIAQGWMDLHEVYKKKGDNDNAGWALRQAMGTGKVDLMFAGPEDTTDDIISRIKEMKNNQSNIKSEESIVNKLFSSWSLEIPENYDEDWEGNKVQLISPDGERCITASALALEGKIPPERILPPADNFMQSGCKIHSQIKKGNLLGYIIENEQFLQEGTYIIQCTIAAPSRLIMLTFTIPNKKVDKEWALQVINSVKFHPNS